MKGNLQLECPLGKLFRPSVITLSSPEQIGVSPSNLSLPSGKHLMKKSGLGRPTINLIPFVMIPLRSRDMDNPEMERAGLALSKLSYHFPTGRVEQARMGLDFKNIRNLWKTDIPRVAVIVSHRCR